MTDFNAAFLADSDSSLRDSLDSAVTVTPHNFKQEVKVFEKSDFTHPLHADVLLKNVENMSKLPVVNDKDNFDIHRINDSRENGKSDTGGKNGCLMPSSLLSENRENVQSHIPFFSTGMHSVGSPMRYCVSSVTPTKVDSLLHSRMSSMEELPCNVVECDKNVTLDHVTVKNVISSSDQVFGVTGMESCNDIMVSDAGVSSSHSVPPEKSLLIDHSTDTVVSKQKHDIATSWKNAKRHRDSDGQDYPSKKVCMVHVNAAESAIRDTNFANTESDGPKLISSSIVNDIIFTSTEHYEALNRSVAEAPSDCSGNYMENSSKVKNECMSDLSLLQETGIADTCLSFKTPPPERGCIWEFGESSGSRLLQSVNFDSAEKLHDNVDSCLSMTDSKCPSLSESLTISHSSVTCVGPVVEAEQSCWLPGDLSIESKDSGNIMDAKEENGLPCGLTATLEVSADQVENLIGKTNRDAISIERERLLDDMSKSEKISGVQTDTDQIKLTNGLCSVPKTDVGDMKSCQEQLLGELSVTPKDCHCDAEAESATCLWHDTNALFTQNSIAIGRLEERLPELSISLCHCDAEAGSTACLSWDTNASFTQNSIAVERLEERSPELSHQKVTMAEMSESKCSSEVPKVSHANNSMVKKCRSTSGKNKQNVASSSVKTHGKRQEFVRHGHRETKADEYGVQSKTDLCKNKRTVDAAEKFALTIVSPGSVKTAIRAVNVNGGAVTSTAKDQTLLLGSSSKTTGDNTDKLVIKTSEPHNTIAVTDRPGARKSCVGIFKPKSKSANVQKRNAIVKPSADRKRNAAAPAAVGTLVGHARKFLSKTSVLGSVTEHTMEIVDELSVPAAHPKTIKVSTKMTSNRSGPELIPVKKMMPHSTNVSSAVLNLVEPMLSSEKLGFVSPGSVSGANLVSRRRSFGGTSTHKPSMVCPADTMIKTKSGLANSRQMPKFSDQTGIRKMDVTANALPGKQSVSAERKRRSYSHENAHVLANSFQSVLPLLENSAVCLSTKEHIVNVSGLSDGCMSDNTVEQIMNAELSDAGINVQKRKDRPVKSKVKTAVPSQGQFVSSRKHKTANLTSVIEDRDEPQNDVTCVNVTEITTQQRPLTDKSVSCCLSSCVMSEESCVMPAVETEQNDDAPLEPARQLVLADPAIVDAGSVSSTDANTVEFTKIIDDSNNNGITCSGSRRKKGADQQIVSQLLTECDDSMFLVLPIFTRRSSRRLRRTSIELYRESLENAKNTLLEREVQENGPNSTNTASETATCPGEVVQLAAADETVAIPALEPLSSHVERVCAEGTVSTTINAANSVSLTPSCSSAESVEANVTYSATGRPQRRCTVQAPKEISLSPEVSSPKSRRKQVPPSLEDIYRNRLWRTQMPKERTWESIPESPFLDIRTGADRVFARKVRCAVKFEDVPNATRLRTRRQKAVARGWKPLTKKRLSVLDSLLESKLAEVEDSAESVVQ